jgi:hypothetical protein
MVNTITTPALPRFVLDLSMDDRAQAVQAEHPDYAARKYSWNVLLDAFEGGGGFLDGSYLWPYPVEDRTDYAKRCAMARYHNYVEALVDLYVRFIFTQGVKRQSTNEAYNAWLADVDGAGTHVNEFLKRLAAMALVTGHAGVLVDRTAEASTGPARVDERSRIVVHVFPATTIIDWRFDRERLEAVKLREAGRPTRILAANADDANTREFLVWDREGWARFDADGHVIGGGVPDLGRVPFVIVRPKPSQSSLMLGRPLVSNANTIVAMFNRASEEDEVIRRQAFSVLTVSVPADGSVDEARQQLGGAIGTAKALVVKGDIKYATPDQNVPGAIRDNIAYLVQELYRAAHVRFRRDSLSAESGDAIRLQYTELNEMLQGFAKALAQAEREIARAWFAWSYPTPEIGQREYEKAQLTVDYPDEFFLDALVGDLEAWAQAIGMNLGDTMTRRIKKRAVRRIDPDMPLGELSQVDAEIDAQTGVQLNPSMTLPTDFGDLAPV